MNEEKRQSPRQRTILKIVYKSDTIEDFAENYSHDISRGGLFVKTESPLPPGSIVIFDMQFENRQSYIEGLGRVIWQRKEEENDQAPAGMGIKFLKLNKAGRANLEKILKTKSSGKASVGEPPVVKMKKSTVSAKQKHRDHPPEVPVDATLQKIKALEEREKHFRSIAENINDGLIIFNFLAEILEVNEATCELTGYQKEDLVGAPLDKIGNADTIAGIISQLIDNGSLVCDTFALTPDGTKVPISFSGKVVSTHDQGVIQCLVRYSPSHEQLEAAMEAIETLEAEKTELNEINQSLDTDGRDTKTLRQESIEQLAAGIGHHFGNLLVPIAGYVEVALKEMNEKDPLYADLEQVFTMVDHARELTKQLLAFGRHQALEKRVVGINQVIFDAAQMLRRIVGDNVQLVTNLEAEPDSIRADRSQIMQIMVDLALNAAEAMPQGGRLSVETANTTLDETYIDPHTGSTNDYVTLTVHDTGQGMNEEILSHLFEPFVSDRGTGKGNGLGLSAVHGIVKQHGGHIGVESQPQVGTTFKISLPRADESQQSQDEDLSRAAQGKGAGKTVLVVMDTKNIGKLVRRVLTKSGYQVIEAKDANEAQLLTASHEKAIDLLLVDITPSSQDGKRLIDGLVESYPEMKVLYLPGCNDDPVDQQDLSRDNTDLLPAFFTIDDLLQKVRLALG